MSRESGYTVLKRQNEENFKKWGEWMKRAQVAEARVNNLEKREQEYWPIGKISDHAMLNMRKDICGFRYGKLVLGPSDSIEGHFVDADACYHLWEWKESLKSELDAQSLRILELEAMLEKSVEQRNLEMDMNTDGGLCLAKEYDAELQAAADAVRKGRE